MKHLKHCVVSPSDNTNISNFNSKINERTELATIKINRNRFTNLTIAEDIQKKYAHLRLKWQLNCQ